MKLTFVFKVNSGNKLILRRKNQYLLQALVYNLLDSEYARFLHAEGFVYEGKRHFKLFSFSKLYGNGPIALKDDFVLFQPPVKLVITSPVNAILEQLATNALSMGEIRLGNNLLSCKEVKVEYPRAEGEEIAFRTLSPIVCYSTLKKHDNSNFTYYYSTKEREFGEQIYANLMKKFQLIAPLEEVPEGAVKIENVGRVKEDVRFFSSNDNRPIKGWSGRFKLCGPKALLQVALDAGLGAKNSAGFGCIDLVLNKKEGEVKTWDF